MLWYNKATVSTAVSRLVSQFWPPARPLSQSVCDCLWAPHSCCKPKQTGEVLNMFFAGVLVAGWLPHSCYWCQSHRWCRHWVSQSVRSVEGPGRSVGAAPASVLKIDWSVAVVTSTETGFGTVSVDVKHHVAHKLLTSTSTFGTAPQSLWSARLAVSDWRDPPPPPPPPTNTEVASLHSERQVTLTDRPSVAGLVPQVGWSGLWRPEDSDPVILLREEKRFYANVLYCLIILLKAFFITY